MISANPLAIVLKGYPGLMLHGALGVARSLSGMGVRVAVFQDVPWAPIATSRHVRQVIAGNLEASGPERTLRQLRRVAAAEPAAPLLLAVDDIAALFVADHAAELRGKFIFSENAPELVHALTDKGQLQELCARTGMAAPAGCTVADGAQLEDFIAGATFPVMVKSRDQRLLHARKQALSAAIARTPAELRAIHRRMEDGRRPNLMVQEYIPGGADASWIFHGYFDDRSECLFGVCGSKLRAFPEQSGATCLGVCRANEAVRRQSIDFLSNIGYRGIVDLEYLFDRRDGRYKLLDANPRIGANLRLFVDEGGLDAARAAYLDLTGQGVIASKPADGRTWAVEGDDLLACLRYYRESGPRLGRWLKTLASSSERAWFSRDDIVPFLAMAMVFSLKAPIQLARGY